MSTMQEQRSRRAQHKASRDVGVGQMSVMSQSITSKRVLLGQSYHQDAKKFIGEALTADEKGDRMNALELYNKSLSIIRSGLAALQSSVGSADPQDPQLHELRGKLESMKDKIKQRMEVLLQYEIESRALAKSTTTRPPSTSSFTASTTSQTSTVSGKTGKTGTANGTIRNGSKEEVKADLLFNMDRGIGLFEVDGRGHVRKYEDVDAFSIFKYEEQIEGQPPAFLQCGGFIYPLIPGGSPILKSGERMYMFPNLKNEDGTSVGVCLDDASETELAQLDQMLQELAQLKTSEEVTEMIKDQEGVGVAKEEKEEPTWGTTVAGGIDKGVSWMSTKIAQGTEVAGNLIMKGATKLRDRIEPNEKPTEISPAVQKGVVYTKKATKCVVGVSDFLMMSLAKLTVKVGRGVMGVAKDSEYVKGYQVNPHAKEAWKVTKSGLIGAAEVFTDLARGAVAVVQSTGKEASRTVGHKYGSEAEMVADNSLSAAGNTAILVHTYWSWKTWGITLMGKIGEVMTKENRENRGK